MQIHAFYLLHSAKEDSPAFCFAQRCTLVFEVEEEEVETLRLPYFWIKPRVGPEIFRFSIPRKWKPATSVLNLTTRKLAKSFLKQSSKKPTSP